MSAVQDIQLKPLFAPLAELRGIGPALLRLLTRVVGGDRVIDLLFHLPESYLDRRVRPTIATAQSGQIATLAVEVVRHEPPANSRQPWKVVVTDGTGFAELVFFRFTRQAQTPPGAKLLVSGKIERFGDRLAIPHPEHMVPAARPDRLPDIEPVWPLTAGLWPRQVAMAMARALERVPDFPEWHDRPLLAREKWPGFVEALRMVQAPTALPGPRPRRRLAYDELLAGQIALRLIRGRARKRAGRPVLGDGRLRGEALARFGHAPTNSQAQAIQEIDADLESPRRMLRLLQGDVGSGKTLVALMAMLRAVEAGAQAALMAPTEVLVKQHHRTLSRLCPVPVAMLTGSVKGRERTKLLAGLADGSIPIVVGTHALFQEAVVYRDLALAVIDEQHRFGVEQRLSLGAKGESTDVLVMPDVMEALGRKLKAGGRVYWVCPMVHESEALDLAAAEARFVELQSRFGGVVGLAHGQQDPEVRDAALADFAAGNIRLLVATTVVEVGVDVPEASVMVIDHAERFGLAQLHQLRGRVGRGAEASFCLLLHEDGLPETARKRLTMLRDTEDGFVIADADFRLRGGGDVLGKRQAGLPGFRLADPVEQEDLLHMAYRDAQLLLEKDPGLISERGRAVRVLLRLFETKAAMGTVVSG